MPELPEVETIARTLRPHVLHARIGDVKVLREDCVHPLSYSLPELAGCGVEGIRRRGKLLLLDLDACGGEHLILAVHLRMTGRIYTMNSGAEPTPHTRCIFSLNMPDGKKKQLFFDDIRRFGRILAIAESRLEMWPFWRTLGPEPLEIDETNFSQILRKRFSHVKAALLDQKLVAGIGNIYADELLFQAQVSPLRAADSLSNEECSRIWLAMREVLQRAISQCGSSIRDYRDANGNAGSFQNSFAVYGRGGQSCKRCGRTLQKVKVAGRSTVYCPQCQH